MPVSGDPRRDSLCEIAAWAHMCNKRVLSLSPSLDNKSLRTRRGVSKSPDMRARRGGGLPELERLMGQGERKRGGLDERSIEIDGVMDLLGGGNVF